MIVDKKINVYMYIYDNDNINDKQNFFLPAV